MELALPGTRWDQSATFGMSFQGGAALTIGTDRHRIDGATLSVTDRGFGNVLKVLEFNADAIAFTEGRAISFSLADAPYAIQKFRACAAATRVAKHVVDQLSMAKFYDRQHKHHEHRQYKGCFDVGAEFNQTHFPQLGKGTRTSMTTGRTSECGFIQLSVGQVED